MFNKEHYADSYSKQDATGEYAAFVSLKNNINNKSIKLFGAAHVGFKDFYDLIFEQSKSCDLFLYEAFGYDDGSSPVLNSQLEHVCEKAVGEYQELALLLNDFYCDVDNGSMESYIQKGLGIKYTDLTEILISNHENKRVFYQDDVIDYNNLPSNWQVADLSIQELESKFPKILKHDSILHLSDDLGLRIDRSREKIVCKKVHLVEKNPEIKTIGIFYGADHIPFFMHHFLNKGYFKEDIEWIKYSF